MGIYTNYNIRTNKKDSILSIEGVRQFCSINDFIDAIDENSDSKLLYDQNNNRPFASDIQTKNINAMGKKIYERLNPEYKKHIGIINRFVLWFLSCFCFAAFNKKLYSLIKRYYNSELNIKLIDDPPLPSREQETEMFNAIKRFQNPHNFSRC